MKKYIFVWVHRDLYVLQGGNYVRRGVHYEIYYLYWYIMKKSGNGLFIGPQY